MNGLRSGLLAALLRRGLLGALAASLLWGAAPAPCRAETKTSSATTVNDGTASRTAQGGELTAGAEAQAEAQATTEYSNAGDDALGSSDLQNGKSVWSDSVELVNESDSVGGENAHAGYSVQATAGGEVLCGSNGVQAKGEIGIEAELNALAQFAVGDENFGGGGAAEAKVNALLKAEATVGAYIDSKGLTLGLDAKAEAMVSAEASLSLNLTLFGIQTTVTATVKGQAGASANASALVTIGFDGKVYFKLGAGATAGLGGGVTFNAAVDAQQLMENLGFESLDQLIGWCEQLVDDPDQLAEELAKEAAKKAAGALLDQAKDDVIGEAKELAGNAFSLAENMLGSAGSLPGGGGLLGSAGSGLQSLFGGSSILSPAGSGTGGGTGGGACGGNAGAGSGAGSGGAPAPDYKRDGQFNSWSR